MYFSSTHFVRQLFGRTTSGALRRFSEASTQAGLRILSPPAEDERNKILQQLAGLDL